MNRSESRASTSDVRPAGCAKSKTSREPRRRFAKRKSPLSDNFGVPHKTLVKILPTGLVLLVTQSHHRIDPGGPPRRQGARRESDSCH
jgi:hypothetical protein